MWTWARTRTSQRWSSNTAPRDAVRNRRLDEGGLSHDNDGFWKGFMLWQMTCGPTTP